MQLRLCVNISENTRSKTFTNHADVVVTVEGAVYIHHVFPFTVEIIRHHVDEIQVSSDVSINKEEYNLNR